MEVFRNFFETEEHFNWFKDSLFLYHLDKSLKPFIDEQTENFHNNLRNKCGEQTCDKECVFTHTQLQQNQVPSLDCEVCSRWRDEIKENSTGGKIMWSNCEPHLWAKNKWEVAKAYMTDGQKNKRSIDEFETVTLLTLMARCKFFKKFEPGKLCKQANDARKVRHVPAHAPGFLLKKEDLLKHCQIIRELCEALERHDPRFEGLSKDMNKIQNIDPQLVLKAVKEDPEMMSKHEAITGILEQDRYEELDQEEEGVLDSENTEGQQAEEEDQDDASIQHPEIPWCFCGCCKVMPTEVECRCCKKWKLWKSRPGILDKHQCVTNLEDFTFLINAPVLEAYFHELKIKWKKQLMPEGPNGELSNKQYRFVVYRFVLRWVLEERYLGRHKREVLPSCIVTAIRRKYPSPDGTYTGFKEAEEFMTQLAEKTLEKYFPQK